MNSGYAFACANRRAESPEHDNLGQRPRFRCKKFPSPERATQSLPPRNMLTTRKTVGANAHQ